MDMEPVSLNLLNTSLKRPQVSSFQRRPVESVIITEDTLTIIYLRRYLNDVEEDS